MLKKYGLDRKTFPILDAHFEGIAKNPAREAFVNRALADTDRRVNEGKPVAPSFLMACVFWHEVSARWKAFRDDGEGLMPALQAAVDATFDARIGDISGRGKLAADMREIWLMQPRFDKRTGSSPAAMLAAAALPRRVRLHAPARRRGRDRHGAGRVVGRLLDGRRRETPRPDRERPQAGSSPKPREPKAAARDPRPIKPAGVARFRA